MPKNILITSVGTGLGHIKQAKAIEKAFKEKHPDYNIKNVDLLEYSSFIQDLIYRKSYEEIVKKLPGLWGYIYKNTNANIVKKINIPRTIFDRINAVSFLKVIEEFKPDAFITTHFITGAIASNFCDRKKVNMPIFVVLTDYEAHPIWLIKGVEKYFVSHQEVKHQLMMLGVNEINVKATGLPVDPIFDQGKNLKKLRDKYGIKNNVPTVLLMAGGVGTLPAEDIINNLKHIKENLQLIVLCGRDQKLYNKVKTLQKKDSRVKLVFGFISFKNDFVDELMRISDLLVSKAGASTLSESLALRLPIIALNSIPGQEEANVDFILENGLGLKTRSCASLIYKLNVLLKDPKKIEKMKKNIRGISKSGAAFDIVEDIINSLKPQML